MTLGTVSQGCGPGKGDDDDSGGDGDADADADGDGDGDADAAAWTVFVYGHADHTLSNSLVTDILEMGRADLSDDVQVIVMTDYDASQTIGGGEEHFPEGTEWLRIVGGGAEPETIHVEDEQDLDDPAVLAASVATAFSEHPARRHGLILWDHGGAWLAGFGGDSQNGTRAPTPMLPGVVADAVRQGLADSGAFGGEDPPLDFFAFDTCLMAGAEVIAEFADVADVYIANAEIDYGDGWDYEATLSWLSEHADAPSEELATTEAAFWDAHHAEASINDQLLRSHVALDLGRLQGFQDAWANFVATWLASETLSGLELGRAAFFALPPYSNQLDSPTPVPELRDAGQFLSAMVQVSDPDVAGAASDAEAALGGMILGSSQGALRESAAQLGVHVELSLPVNITGDLLAAYGAQAPAWVAATGWNDALTVLAALNDGAGPAMDVSIANGDAPDAAHLPTITFGVTDDDTAEASVDLAVVADDAPDVLIYFGIVAKGAVEPGFSYDFAWNGTLASLPDGAGGSQPIMVTVWQDIGVSADDPGEVVPPVLATFGLLTGGDGEEALAALLFQDGDEDTGLAVLLDPPVTLPLEDISRDFPGTTFTPVYATYSLSSGEEGAIGGAPIPIDASTLPLSWNAAPASQYVLLTTLTDVFGNASYDAQAVTVETPIGR